MRIGTKSILFGVHSPPIHAFFMGLAWLKLYGFSREFLDPRLHLCFWLHDIGYWGCETMDGEDGEKHPEFGANIIGKLFGDEWWRLCRWHSGTMVALDIKQYGLLMPANEPHPSKLYSVDKLASALYPKWLYKLLSGWSGEWIEYAEHQFGLKFLTIEDFTRDGYKYLFSNGKDLIPKSFEDWHTPAMKYMRERAYRFVESESWETMKEGMKKNND